MNLSEPIDISAAAKELTPHSVGLVVTGMQDSAPAHVLGRRPSAPTPERGGAY